MKYTTPKKTKKEALRKTHKIIYYIKRGLLIKGRGSLENVLIIVTSVVASILIAVGLCYVDLKKEEKINYKKIAYVNGQGKSTVYKMKLEPKKHLDNILQKKLPCTVDIMGVEITIGSHKVYPPGKLARMYTKYLLKNIDIEGKAIADIGAGCSTLGIVLAKNRARLIVGVDITPESIRCSNQNIQSHALQNKVKILGGNGAGALFEKYGSSFDFVVCGPPWSTMSSQQFEKVEDKNKSLYRSFYDVDDALITSVLTKGFELLKNSRGNVYISACMKTIDRINKLCKKHGIKYEIVATEDLHKDGNLHYILRLNKKV
jgi:release factor glutamine methyltransferase